MELVEAAEQKYEIMDNQTKTKYTDWVRIERAYAVIIKSVKIMLYIKYDSHAWHIVSIESGEARTSSLAF